MNLTREDLEDAATFPDEREKDCAELQETLQQLPKFRDDAISYWCDNREGLWQPVLDATTPAGLWAALECIVSRHTEKCITIKANELRFLCRNDTRQDALEALIVEYSPSIATGDGLTVPSPHGSPVASNSNPEFK